MKLCRLKYIIFHEIPHWIKCRLWYKYNRITIKTLPSTWVDRDNLMVHALFGILDDFVNKEKPDLIVDWDSDPEHRQARDKMDELINWWKNIYLKFDAWSDVKLDYDYKNSLIKTQDDPVIYTMKPMSPKDRKRIKNIIKKENEMEEELNQKLIEILSIRKYLWV